jgi:hypothetical protein
MLLDDLLEASVVQLREFGQVMHVRDDIAQVCLEEQEVLIGRAASSASVLPSVSRTVLKTGDDIVDLSLTRLNTMDYLVALDLLERKDLVELALQQRDESLLILLCPGLARRFGVLRSGLGDELGLEGIFEIFVGNVMPEEVLDHRRTELLPEPRQYIPPRCQSMFLDLRLRKTTRNWD